MSGIIGLTPDMRSGIIGGFNTEYDVWNFAPGSGTDSTAGDITSDLARQTSNGQTYLGKGMTQSSGVFTFPSTGTWDVRATAELTSSMEHQFMKVGIYFVGTEVSRAYVVMPNSDADALQGTCTCNAVLKIATLATDVVKFNWAQEITDSGSLVGTSSGAVNRTCFTFQKLSPSTS